MVETTKVPVAGRAGRAVSRVVRVVVGVAVLAAGVGVAGMLVATRPESPRVTRPDPLLVVRTFEAVAADVPRVWEGYGTARAMESADIPAQVSGMVTERPASVEAGLPVAPPAEGREPGTPLVGDRDAEAYLRAIRALVGDALVVQIDPTDYVWRLGSALEQAEATRAQIGGLDVSETRVMEMLALARQEREIQERELGRIIEASQMGGGNESEVERRRGALLLAQRAETNLLEQLDQLGPRRAETQARLRELMSAVEVARQNVARTVVTSPIAGVLQEVNYRPGEWAPAGSVIARVVDLSRVEVPLRVPVEAAASIAVGDVATLRTDTQGGQEWSGRVVRLAPEVDPQTRSFTVFVEVVQQVGAGAGGGEVGLLRPGQFVVGRITSGQTWRVLLVPRRAVLEDGVFVAEDGGEGAAAGSRVARRVSVRTLFNLTGVRENLHPLEDQWSAVEMDGVLDEGDAIIVSNLDDLHEGLLVSLNGTGGGVTAGGADGGGSGGVPAVGRVP